MTEDSELREGEVRKGMTNPDPDPNTQRPEPPEPQEPAGNSD